MVFYRTYRPQTIEELDSEDVKKTLHTVLSQKDTPHAFLFTGPKGLGKTSTARIVAKYVNCVSKKGEKPCNKCDQCLSITSGTNIDILEIDGASNRGIDEIRDLREKIRLLPVLAQKKVYIIDEVHMLTQEAFNALLKTLEEPPAHAMFILCTTESQKVPGTILSRCFHIQFKKATIADLVQSFERIMKGEKIATNKDALELIASFADGSFRDGAKILEEITLGLQGEKLTKELVDARYHVTSIDHDVKTFLEALVTKDAKKGLEVVAHLSDLGIDFKYFTEKLLFSLHQMLLENIGVMSEKKWADIDLQTIRQLADLLSKAYGEMRFAVIPQLPLELAIVEWAGEEELKVQSSKLEVTKELKTNESVIAREAKPDTVLHLTKQSQNSEPFQKPDLSLWWQLIDGVKEENHTLAGVLRSCKLVRIDSAEVVIETPYKFHKERLEEKKALDLLEKVCKNITGKELAISVVLKSE